MSELMSSHCRPCKGEADRLSGEQASVLMSEIDKHWEQSQDKLSISRVFRFANYYETIAFVNALAWIAHREDHHPDLEVGYNRCTVTFATHSVGGLSRNDFICAARLDAITSDPA